MSTFPQFSPIGERPRIHGELLKLGIDIGETSVSKYTPCRRNQPSQTWRTFLENHLKSTVSVDFSRRPPFASRYSPCSWFWRTTERRIVHFNVTAHPTAEWTALQVREAFPFEQVPKYLLRDRDGIFGAGFTQQVEDLSIEEALSTPRSPWQRAYIERVTGSIRCECLDHIIVFNEGSLYRRVQSFVDYYQGAGRTFRWRRTLGVVGQCNRLGGGERSPCRRSVVSIIGTSVGQHKTLAP